MQNQISLVGQQMVVTEIPAMVAVETIFITDQMAKQKDIQSEALILSPVYIDDETQVNNNANNVQKMQDIGIMAKPTVEHFAGQTECQNPQRDREIQTVKLPYQRDIGIQCSWETDTISEDITNGIDFLDKNIEKKCYKQFLEFVQENTSEYANTKSECMKCGEVCKNSKEMLSHMALHWGPSALCEICGECVEHSSLLTLHQCAYGPSKKSSNRNLYQQCPLYACGIMLKSKTELQNHLSGHIRLAFYQCLATERNHQSKAQSRSLSKFYRSTLFKKSMHNKRVRIRTNSETIGQRNVNKRQLRWTARDVFRCQICLIRFSSPYVFVGHRGKCIKRFMKRLKDMKPKNISSLNADNPLTLETM